MFVYWGAKWCPPCNQVQATLFNRQEFIERSRNFVPVYIDGDSPGAQKLSARFNARFYPTMVLFDRSGAELTRLPGEVDPAQYNEVLTLGLGAQRSVKSVLAQARAGSNGLAADDWKLLAFYSWETDQQQLTASQDEAATLLAQLAAACPPDHADASMRLLLKSLTLGARKPADAAAVAARSQSRERVLALLGSEAQARRHMDVIGYGANELVRSLTEPKTAGPPAAGGRAGDRAAAPAGRREPVACRPCRGPGGAHPAGAHGHACARRTLPAPLLADVRSMSTAFDREITDGYERQAVITTVADALEEAGLIDESDALLKANLPRSHSPYYLMSGLADNAKKRGDKTAAIDWYAQAFEGSVGPATRLQWGAATLARWWSWHRRTPSASRPWHASSSMPPRPRPMVSKAAAGARCSAWVPVCCCGTRTGHSAMRCSVCSSAWTWCASPCPPVAPRAACAAACCGAAPPSRPPERRRMKAAGRARLQIAARLRRPRAIRSACSSARSSNCSASPSHS